MKNNILYGSKDKVITNETIESKAQEFITLYQEEFSLVKGNNIFPVQHEIIIIEVFAFRPADPVPESISDIVLGKCNQ